MKTILLIIYSLSKVCDSGDMDTRRLVGNVVEVRKNPAFMVQLEFVVPRHWRDSHYGSFCGGTIIHWEWILSAAHCFYYGLEPRFGEYASIPFNLSYLSIMIGEKYAGAGRYIRPLDYFLHDGFLPSPNSRFDIALIKTVRMQFYPDAYPSPVSAVTLNTKRIDVEDGNTVVRLYGWGGKVFEKDPTNKSMEYADVKVYPWTACKRRNFSPLHAYDICTESTNNTGPCDGDSGGPVMLDGKQVAVISRLTSGIICGVSPAVHTLVVPFQGWIYDTVGLNLETWRNTYNNGLHYTEYVVKEDLELPDE